MEKRITIHDVAREAGVSSATVSYIINHRDEQKISEATKKKVWEIIHLLHYRPNQQAQALRASRRYHITVLSTLQGDPLLTLEFFRFIQEFSKTLAGKDYDLVYFPQDTDALVKNMDAIIGYNLPRERFTGICSDNMAPIVAVDCEINDPIFFQINNDYQRIREDARRYFASDDFAFVSLPLYNDSLRQKVLAAFPSARFLGTAEEILAVPERRVVTIHSVCARLLEKEHSVYLADNYSADKLDRILQCVAMSMDEKEYKQHDFIV